MVSILKTKYTNHFNLILYTIFFLVVILISIKKSSEKKESVGVVASIDKSYKYKINSLNIKFNNNESLRIVYPNSFFNVEDFLRIKIGDSLQYNFLNNDEVSKIKNLNNDNELDELYFSIQESNGFQILIIFLLIVYNIIQMKKLRDRIQLSAVNTIHLEKNTLIKRINNFTKKHSFITLLGLGIFGYFLYVVFNSIAQNQSFFDNIYFYKYFIMLLGLLIPMPFVILNYKLLRKVNLSKR